MQVKNLNSPDEVRTPSKTKLEVVKVGDSTVMRAAFDPGWKWSECIKPVAGTPSCQSHHVGYVMSGKMKIKMDDGTEKEIGPGDAVDIPPGHDAWVIGNEQCVMIDFGAGAAYAKQAK